MKTRHILFMLFILVCCNSCKKDFLNKKPDQALLVPTTLSDLQALLDNSTIMNVIPTLNLISTDDLFVTDNGFKAYTNNYERNTYLWSADIFEGRVDPDWNKTYQIIFYANVALDGVAKLQKDTATQKKADQIIGSALFYRAFAFYNLAQEFATPYRQSTATEVPGVPIRLTADVNIKSSRGTLQGTYDQIIADLVQALSLVPDQVAFKSRPSKAATLALLARVYQTIEKYDRAEFYASKYLASTSKLIDFNTLSTTATSPFPVVLPNANDEVCYYVLPVSYSFINSTLTGMDTILYRSYSSNDLRKQLFVRDRGSNIYTFKGFRGIATDEVYLIRAECYARENNISGAMNDLNTLLQTRWKKNTFVPFTATTAEDALRLILTERRKELFSRGLRWTDLRRLNMDPRFQVAIKRIINSVSYALPPNDNRYTFPIPIEETTLNGLTQNPR